MSKKLGVCLSGGGARGGYQIGALKALDEIGILNKVDAFSGTSIGAANAAVVASKGLKAAEDVWLNMPKNNMPRNKVNGKSRVGLPNVDQGYFSMEVFEKVLLDAVDYAALAKREVYVTVSQGGHSDKGLFELVKSSYNHYFKKDLQVQYMDLKELDEYLVHRSIMASCAIPVVFSPVKIGGTKYYDGGVFDRVPITPLIDAGCDEIIIIDLHRYPVDLEPFSDSIVFHELKHTKKALGKVLKFSDTQTRRLIELGYKETMDYFKNHKHMINI